MPVPKTTLILAVFLLSVFFTSCVEDKDYGEANNLRPNVNRETNINSNQNVAEDDERQLDRYINLPFVPTENLFREENLADAAGSDESSVKGRRLTVVLKFSQEDAAELVEKAKVIQRPFETKIEAETWFPAELIAKSGTSGSEQLKGTGYSARDFLKSPWTTGSLIKIDETDYFVLILQSP